MILEDEIFYNTIPENEKHTDIDKDNKMIKCFLNLSFTNKISNPIS